MILYINIENPEMIMLAMPIIYASIVEPNKLQLKYVAIALVGVHTNYVTMICLILIFCLS